jgi:hypothetical protein
LQATARRCAVTRRISKQTGTKTGTRFFHHLRTQTLHKQDTNKIKWIYAPDERVLDGPGGHPIDRVLAMESRHEPRGVRRAPHQRQTELGPESVLGNVRRRDSGWAGFMSPEKPSGLRGEALLQPRTFDLEREARPRVGDMSSWSPSSALERHAGDIGGREGSNALSPLPA